MQTKQDLIIQEQRRADLASEKEVTGDVARFTEGARVAVNGVPMRIRRVTAHEIRLRPDRGTEYAVANGVMQIYRIP